MKTSRIILITGVSHFALWWLSYAAMHLAGYNPFTPSSYSVFGRISFDVMSVLTFPLILDSVYSVFRDLPNVLFVALASCIWAVCIGGLVHTSRHRGILERSRVLALIIGTLMGCSRQPSPSMLTLRNDSGVSLSNIVASSGGIQIAIPSVVSGVVTQMTVQPLGPASLDLYYESAEHRVLRVGLATLVDAKGSYDVTIAIQTNMEAFVTQKLK